MKFVGAARKEVPCVLCVFGPLTESENVRFVNGQEVAP